MSGASEGHTTDRLRLMLTRLGPALLIAALVAWHAAYNWYWLSSNVVLTGWDKARHLAQSVTYNSLLKPLTPQTFFGAFISDSVRPPFAPMAAVPLYRLFGTSSDVAVMLNVLYLAVTLIATYRVGVLLRGRRLGLLSLVLLALFPMFYAMSRYFYLEFPLTALVAVTMWLLLASAGFQKRGRSLLFGLCLGLGLLTKRTYVAFVLAPVVLVVLTSDVFPSLGRRLRGGIRIDLKHAVVALGGGLGLAALWLVPNWSTIQSLPLGGWIFPIWAGLVAITLYLLLRSPGPDVNFSSALGLGAALASTWYLANVGFVQRMLLFGYGVNDPRGRTINIGSFYTYVDYLVTLVNQHVSLMVTIILLGAAVAVAIAMLRKRRLLTLLKGLDVGWWVVVLWLVGPYLVLTLSIYHEPRAITPVLPAIALLGAGLILQISWRAARTVLVVMLVFFGVVQFYAVSFERLHGLVEAASLRLPLLGETSLLGRGGYLQRPDAEATDSGYWIEPDVLERMERERLAQGWDSASLGLLVNDKQINFEHFAYLTLAGGYYPALTVERLARAHGPEPVYPRLFEHDFLLVKPENDAIDADSQAAIERILEDPSSLFQQSFELDKRYLLPDGGTVYLYRRLMRAPGGNTAEFFPKLADTLNGMAREGDAVVVIPPDLVPLLGQQQDKGLEVYALPNQESTDDVMAELAAEHDLVFAIYGEWDGDDLDDAGRRWLNERGYRAWQEWFGPTQLVVYGLASEAEGSEVKRVGAELGGAVTLDGYSLWDGQAEARDILYLTLLWQARQPLEQSYKVFVHLVDGDGRLVAQADSEPVAGLRPTTGWEVGETIRDQVGLWIPPELEPGAYALLVGMYDPETLERLPLLNATEEAVGDAVLLDSVLLPESRR